MPPYHRKYPTEEKTTTPEGLREYRRLQQRDIRQRQSEGDTQTMDLFKQHLDSEKRELMEEFVADRIREGRTQEQAEDEFKILTTPSSMQRDERDSEPQSVAVDSVDYTGPLEVCMGLRRDVHRETEDVARTKCEKLMNDPMYRHLDSESSPMEVAKAIIDWNSKNEFTWLKNSRDIKERLITNATIRLIQKGKQLAAQVEADEAAKELHLIKTISEVHQGQLDDLTKEYRAKGYGQVEAENIAKDQLHKRKSERSGIVGNMNDPVERARLLKEDRER